MKVMKISWCNSGNQQWNQLAQTYFYAHGALTDEGVSGAAMCSGGGGAAWRNSGSGWIPKVFHASFVGGFYNRVIPFLWSRLLGDIPRRENPFVKALRKLDEIINSQVTTFRYIQDPSVISRLAKHWSTNKNYVWKLKSQNCLITNNIS